MITLQLLQNPNVKAFLDTIAYSEGTDQYKGDDQYRVMFGSRPTAPRLFTGWADHPRQVYSDKYFPQGSDAAGRYQLMSYTWNTLRQQLGLRDFSPRSQDLCALKLFDQRNALNDVCLGHFDTAVEKLCRVWASFPCQAKGGQSFYGGQPSRLLVDLRNFYIKHGGQVAVF